MLRRRRGMTSASLALFLCLAGGASAPGQTPLGSAFNYQGHLKQNGSPVNGTVDLDFSLWNDPTANNPGNQIGSVQSIAAVSVSSGLFTVQLDAGGGFGASAFNGERRWLQISVNGTPLSPRQELTAASNALFALSAATAANATNATQLNGQPAAFYQNASNIGSGTLADPRLSGNVALLGGAQTFTGIKTFSIKPSFAAAGTPFLVSNSTLVTNLNADLLDGLDSTAFLQSIPVPLTLSGTNTTHIIRGENASQTSGASGVFGETTGGFGLTSGLLGRSVSQSGRGVSGEATGGFGTTYGVHGQSDSTSGRGVFGLAAAATGLTYGGRFESNSTSGIGVYGAADATNGSTYGGRFESSSLFGTGVYGLATAGGPSSNTIGGRFESAGTSGIGVLGLATAATGTNWGVYGQSSSPAGFGGFFERHFGAAGLTVELSGPNGAISTDGFLHREYAVSTRSAAIPIAYGSISAAGAINGGTGNFTVTHVAGSGQYDIVVDGETYSNNATVTITPVTNSPRITGVADAGTGFRVNMWNQTFALVDNAFQFTIWASNPAEPG